MNLPQGAWLRSSFGVPVVIVGVAGGLTAATYLTIMHLSVHLVGPGTHSVFVQGLIMVAAGVSITMLMRKLGSGGGVDLLVDNIHVMGGTEDIRGLRSLIPTSLICIAAGGSMGPEAPMVEAGGSFGTWLAGRYGLGQDEMRILTITGMAAALAVLFAAPLGAAIFALEILHRRGLQYYEALIPSLVGAFAGYVISVMLTGTGINPIWRLPTLGALSWHDMVWGTICGAVGGLGALLFAGTVKIGQKITSRVSDDLLPVAAAVALTSLFWWSPFALTNGKLQVEEIVTGGLAATTLAIAITAKFVGVIVTILGRWKGGFIIPLFFMGIAGGQLLHFAVPSTNTAVLMVCLAVALNVGVTKTPLGSTLVVTEMAGLAVVPMAIGAAIIALVMTRRTAVITSQRPREVATEGT